MPSYMCYPLLLCIHLTHTLMNTLCALYSDMQKHVSLQLKPGHLITTGLFKYSRSPNYFGELLIYTAFVLLSQSIISVIVMTIWIGGIWLSNMTKKDKSLSRYPGFAAYKQQSGLLFPVNLDWKRLF